MSNTYNPHQKLQIEIHLNCPSMTGKELAKPEITTIGELEATGELTSTNQ